MTIHKQQRQKEALLVHTSELSASEQTCHL